MKMARIAETEKMNDAEGQTAVEAAEQAGEAIFKDKVSKPAFGNEDFLDKADDSAMVPAQPSKANVPAMVEDQFSGLDSRIGFGSFPTIKLDKAKFVVENEEVDSINCVVQQIHSKWLFKADDDNLFYSYDRITDTGGKQVSARIKELEAEGFKAEDIEIKEYLEVVVQMKDTKLAGRFAILSVPPASIRRIAGYRMEIRALHNVDLSKVVTKCVAGPKVSVGKSTFHPWDFSFVSLV